MKGYYYYINYIDMIYRSDEIFTTAEQAWNAGLREVTGICTNPTGCIGVSYAEFDDEYGEVIDSTYKSIIKAYDYCFELNLED